MRKTLGLVFAFIFLSSILSASESRLHPLASPEQASAGADDNSVYLVYYWRAKPGKYSAYSNYSRELMAPAAGLRDLLRQEIWRNFP